MPSTRSSARFANRKSAHRSFLYVSINLSMYKCDMCYVCARTIETEYIIHHWIQAANGKQEYIKWNEKNIQFSRVSVCVCEDACTYVRDACFFLKSSYFWFCCQHYPMPCFVEPIISSFYLRTKSYIHTHTQSPISKSRWQNVPHISTPVNITQYCKRIERNFIL